MQETLYSFEVRKCGKSSCDICPGKLVTPGVLEGELKERVWRFLPLPIHSDENETEFLSYSDTLKCLEKGMTLEEQLKSLPNIKVVKDSVKLIQEAKKRNRDKGGNAFHASKIRGILTCSACSAIRCVYSGKAPGADGGPSLIKLGRIQEKNSNYICGDLYSGNQLFYTREALQ